MKLPEIYIKEFDYDLPEAQIAKFPLEQRSASKLLFYANGHIQHRSFIELPNLLPSQSLLVFNNTKVIEARLKFKKITGAEIEVFLLNPANQENATLILNTKGKSIWQCMVGNKKRWKEGETLTLTSSKGELSVSWKDRTNDHVQFSYPLDFSLQEMIGELGNLPIPPYLNRPTEVIDITRYQTHFATFSGSVAAPTAALHFDEYILKELHKKGMKFENLTLHVGAGTFKPVSSENALNHIMHEEYIIFSKEFISSLFNHPHPVIAVGTTSLRSLESLYWFGVGLHKNLINAFHIPQYFPYEISENYLNPKESLSIILEWMNKNKLSTLEGTSSIFIVPGYQPKMANGIITNFHQPQSTLLLLIAALIGDNWKTIYKEALEKGYRFLSYGDSSLILF